MSNIEKKTVFTKLSKPKVTNRFILHFAMLTLIFVEFETENRKTHWRINAILTIIADCSTG